MQRHSFSAAPRAPSPPLHHPIPQHVSTVPQLRSPPPPSSGLDGQQAAYGYGRMPPQSSDTGEAYSYPAFESFVDGPTAQLGFQAGQSAVSAGQEYVQHNFDRYFNVSALRSYFNVSNSYVLAKLSVVLFPWRHRSWSRQQTSTSESSSNTRSVAGFMPPREDINAPDMYIPLMAFVTYIILSTLIAGTNGTFEPQLLGVTFSNAAVVIGLELLLLWLGKYFLDIRSQSQIFDLVAYSGYKFVGVILTIAISAVSASGTRMRFVGWAMFAYTFLASAFFLLRSLRYVLLPSDNAGGNSGMNPVTRSQRNRRMQFLVFYSYAVQFVLMWWLSSMKFGRAVKAGRGGR
ncbi:hypothetical protein LTR85_004702 [Meristemomyces frigidus]|nr:hypothetical protein LTR85_004702 [Meristemomyces frigidus]